MALPPQQDDLLNRGDDVRLFPMLAACALLAGCGEVRGDGGETPNAAIAEDEGPASSAFEVTVRGALEMTLAGEAALGGPKYGRYHINMATKGSPGGTPVVVIAFGRQRLDRPGAGSYSLGAGGDFGGSVEVYGDVQQEFDIVSGQLVITEAHGDALTGHFSFAARELSEDYGGAQEQLQATGTFRTRPVE